MPPLDLPHTLPEITNRTLSTASLQKTIELSRPSFQSDGFVASHEMSAESNRVSIYCTLYGTGKTQRIPSIPYPLLSFWDEVPFLPRAPAAKQQVGGEKRKGGERWMWGKRTERERERALLPSLCSYALERGVSSEQGRGSPPPLFESAEASAVSSLEPTDEVPSPPLPLPTHVL